MKKLFFLLFILTSTLAYGHGAANFEESDMLKTMKAADKAAILMVHFGTTKAEAKQRSIETLNERVKQTFPTIEVQEAWTSRIVINALKKKGETKLNPTEALEKLKAEGFTHIIVQATTIIEGVEMEALRREVRRVEADFKDIRVGHPLLYTPEDYKKVIKALVKEQKPNEASVLVGHGTYDPATAQYVMLDYMLKAEGHPNYFVSTIEGYPSFADTEKQLKGNTIKDVLLVPFMFVAGKHAEDDIEGILKELLKQKGYNVSVSTKGLGESKEIQDIFIQHIRFAFKHKMLDIMDKKQKYAKGEKGHHHHHHH